MSLTEKKKKETVRELEREKMERRGVGRASVTSLISADPLPVSVSFPLISHHSLFGC